MGRFFRRVWRYLSAAMTGKFEELADPKIQIEQAIVEAERQHALLTQQAANVIAHQKDTELQLNRALEQVEKFSASSRQALLMTEQARKNGNTRDAEKYEAAAQAFAQRLIVAEQEVDALKTLHLQATEAAENAKRAVQQNRMQLEKRSAEKAKLLSQLDQAKMQERMNVAMDSMTSTYSEDVPSLDEVRRKIETRYARAQGAAELHGESVEGKMLEIEQAAVDMEATSRLDDIRRQLGLETKLPEAPAGAEAGAEAALDDAQAGQSVDDMIADEVARQDAGKQQPGPQRPEGTEAQS